MVRLQLHQEIEKLHDDMKAAKASANEEKSLKLFQERKVKELEHRLSTADLETDEQIARLSEQLQESGKTNLELHEQVHRWFSLFQVFVKGRSITSQRAGGLGM